MDWFCIQGVPLPHAQRSRDRLRIHHSPDQDKALTVTECVSENMIKSVTYILV